MPRYSFRLLSIAIAGQEICESNEEREERDALILFLVNGNSS